MSFSPFYLCFAIVTLALAAAVPLLRILHLLRDQPLDLLATFISLHDTWHAKGVIFIVQITASTLLPILWWVTELKLFTL